MTQRKPDQQPGSSRSMSTCRLVVWWTVLQFARFVLSGVIAAGSNFLAVWLARRALSYEVSLVIGAVVALITSFVLSKWYAFGSQSRQKAPSELTRFLAVFFVGFALYWGVAVLVTTVLKKSFVYSATSEILGVLAGSAAMTLSSYVGHRFFTYRTYKIRGSFSASGETSSCGSAIHW